MAGRKEMPDLFLAKLVQAFRRKTWRRKRDSNPRNPFEFNGFQDRRLQPLGHSSNTILHGSSRSSTSQSRQPGIDTFQAPDQFRILDLALRGLLPLDGERTA